jgi:hypothetical protein
VEIFSPSSENWLKKNVRHRSCMSRSHLTWGVDWPKSTSGWLLTPWWTSNNAISRILDWLSKKCHPELLRGSHQSNKKP